jgi:hypothetical protein
MTGDEQDIDMVPDINMVADHTLPEDAFTEPASKPDPNSLTSILGAALNEIEEAGVREAHLLRGVIGKGAFDSLPARK